MREKPANENVVNHLIDFLRMVKFTASGTPPIIDYQSLQQTEGVAKRTITDCKALGIIKIEGKETKWLIKEPVDFRKLSLKILDYRLHKNKKTVHFPIPDFAAIGESLTTIVERLTHILAQQERVAKSPKNGQQSNDADLFRVDDQRLLLIGKIAGGVYKEAFKFIQNPNDTAGISETKQIHYFGG